MNPNVSPQVNVVRGGFQKNRLTGRYAQMVTITNTSSNSIDGPFSFVLDSLSSNATLFNKNSSTACVAPIGSSYIGMNVGSDNTLQPGEKASVVLEFTNPSNQQITYTNRILAGAPQ